jgi:tRNA(Ile)-lysidine synthase
VPNAANDAATDRFTRAIARLIGTPATARDDTARFAVAVSGGPDSMALLLLAHNAFPGRVEAATVDHGLRAQSAEEAVMVATWCAAHAIPHATLRPAQPITGNIQSAARTARYALLDAWRTEHRLDWLMTAHHADDQLETMLMRLNRGSGVAGLAGVRSRTGAILRPLLNWRKRDLAALAEAAGMPVAQDPSNSDPRFDRAALRLRLAESDWLDPLAAAGSAAALAEADAALNWLTQDLAARHVTRTGDAWRLAITEVPREVQRRLVLHLLAQADPAMPAPRGNTLDLAIDRLRQGGKTCIGNWLLQGGAQWTLRPAPPRRSRGTTGAAE